MRWRPGRPRIRSLRFGGEDASAEVDSSISTNVLSDDPIESTELGLRNIDRIARLLVPATTRKGEGYNVLGGEVRRAGDAASPRADLCGQAGRRRRGDALSGGRGGPPYTPVPPGAAAPGGALPGGAWLHGARRRWWIRSSCAASPPAEEPRR